MFLWHKMLHPAHPAHPGNPASDAKEGEARMCPRRRGFKPRLPEWFIRPARLQSATVGWGVFFSSLKL